MINFSKEDLQELEKYSSLCNTEYGEVCQMICSILVSYENYISEEFFDAVKKEASNMLRNFKENSKIIETEEVYKQSFKQLIWE